MKFFTSYFKLQDKQVMDNGEFAVCCPFPHTDGQGNPYHETRASAHINPDKSVFHCKSCDVGLSEAMFLVKKEGISYKNALVFLGIVDDTTNNWENARELYLQSKAPQELVKSLGIEAVAYDLQLGYTGTGVSFPVFVYGDLLDVRTYNPDSTPKVKGKYKSKNLIYPFDLWIDDSRPTLLCAGEKDMAIARANLFNAITFTGGEMSFPKLFKASFKGKKIYIAYDNDEAGHEGATKAAYMLRDAGAIVHVVTGHYEVCTQKGEDIHDFFKKYNKSASEFQNILDNTPEFTFAEYIKAKERVIPRVTIEGATHGQYVDQRFVQSQVQVTSIFEEAYKVPEYVVAEKWDTDGKKNEIMEYGEVREWVLDDSNIQDLLHLMENNITPEKQIAALKKLMRIPAKEPYVRMQVRSSTAVYKAVIADNLENTSDEATVMEIVAYSTEEKLVAGKKYLAEYKPAAHPLGQKVVAIIRDAHDNDIELTNFKVNKDLLRQFQVKSDESVKDKMDELYERAKGFIGVEARKSVMLATDMFYHTPLEFKLGKRVERGYLDVMIIGDPRTMKSATAKAMTSMYELGTVTSLKTATKAGLIGGSDQTSGGWKTKIGLLARNHKGAVIMEEFSGGMQFINELTEIRSSNRVRITRMNGTLDVPAMVRMLSISNPATQGRTSTSLRQYSSGVQVILDLIGASEDIARYDFFLLVDEQAQFISPLDDFDLEPFSKEAYKQRIRWVWSRTADQVTIATPVAQYIVDESQRLNSMYDSHIKLFGPEAWKKISRVAISIAGMLVSTDDEFLNIIVKKEHVDYAVKFLIQCYDNDLFKLAEFVEEERRYSTCTDVDVMALQGIFNNNAVMLNQISLSTEISSRQLQSISGLDQKNFSMTMNALARSYFVKVVGEKYIPSAKFREAMKKVKVRPPTYLKEASEG